MSAEMPSGKLEVVVEQADARSSTRREGKRTGHIARDRLG